MEHTMEGYLKTVEYGTEDEDMWINVLDNHKLYTNEEFDYEVVEVKVVDNAALRTRYDMKRNEFINKGYGEEEIKSCYGFAIEMEHCVMDLVINGPFNRPAQYHILGNNEMGFRVWRHADVCMKFASMRNFKNATLFMYGKRKHVLVERFRKDPHGLTPSIGYDCHVPALAATPTGTLCDNINYSQIYLYSVDSVTLNCVQPCQIYPAAVLTLIEKSVVELLEDPSTEKCEEDEDLSSDECELEEKGISRLLKMDNSSDFRLDGDKFTDFSVSKSVECKLSTVVDEPLPANFQRLLSLFHPQCLNDRFTEVSRNEPQIYSRLTDIDKEVVEMKPRIKFSNLGRGYTDISHGLKWVKLQPLSCYTQYDSTDDQSNAEIKHEQKPINASINKQRLPYMLQNKFCDKLPNLPQTNKDAVSLSTSWSKMDTKSSQSSMISPAKQEPLISPDLEKMSHSIPVRLTERFPKTVPTSKGNLNNIRECFKSPEDFLPVGSQTSIEIFPNSIRTPHFEQSGSTPCLLKSPVENDISPGFCKSSESKTQESPTLQVSGQTVITPDVVKDICTTNIDLVATDVIKPKGQLHDLVSIQSVSCKEEESTKLVPEKKDMTNSSNEADDVARNLQLLKDLIQTASKAKDTSKDHLDMYTDASHISVGGYKSVSPDALEFMAEAEQSNALITSVNDLIMRLNKLDNNNTVFDVKDWTQQFGYVSDGINKLIDTTSVPALPDLINLKTNLSPAEQVKVHAEKSKEELSNFHNFSFASTGSATSGTVQNSETVTKIYNPIQHIQNDKHKESCSLQNPTNDYNKMISQSSVQSGKCGTKIVVKFHGRTLLKGKGVPARNIPMFPIYLRKPFKSNGEPMEIPIDPRRELSKLHHISISPRDLPIPQFVFDEYSVKNIKRTVSVYQSNAMNAVHTNTSEHEKTLLSLAQKVPYSQSNKPISSTSGQHKTIVRRNLVNQFKQQITVFSGNSITSNACSNNNDNLQVVDMELDSSDGKLHEYSDQSRYITIKPISAKKHKLDTDKKLEKCRKREKMDLMSRNEQHDLLELEYDKWKQKK